MTISSVKLTKRAVDAAKPTEKRFILWDADLPGFGLRVEPTGRKTFIARYRAGGGRDGVLRQTTLGRFGTVTLEEARRIARKTLGQAAAGGDPLGEKRAARQRGVTVAEVCDWYLTQAAAGRILGRRGRPIRPATLTTDRSRIEQHVKPLIGARPVRRLTMRDIEEMQADIAAGRTAKPVPKANKPRGGITAGGEAVARRTLGMVRSIFGHAVRKQIIEANPALGARQFAARRRNRRLSLDEVRQLGEVMRTDPTEPPTCVALIRFILLTGFRRGEAVTLKPEAVLAAGGVSLAETKTGPQVRPIGQAATDLLNERMATPGTTEWLFPSDRGPGHFIALTKVLKRICGKAGLPGDITPHTLRHTFASVAGDLGYSELTIAGLLGHSLGSMTASYVHLDVALVAAADRVSRVIADALDGASDADILELRPSAVPGRASA